MTKIIATPSSRKTEIKVTASPSNGANAVYPQVLYGYGPPPDDVELSQHDLYVDMDTGQLYEWSN